MATSIFDDKTNMPTKDMVNTAIADTKSLWNKIQAHVEEN